MGKLNKKAGDLIFGTIIIVVICAALVAIIYYTAFRNAGNNIKRVSILQPTQDEECVKFTKAEAMLGQLFTDNDDDGRDDKCDWCVCAQGIGCHNDDQDLDKDKMPDLCDSGPYDKTVIDFSSNCINVYDIDGGRQCMP